MSPVNVPLGDDVFAAEMMLVTPVLRTGNLRVEDPRGTENEPDEKAPPWNGM